MPTNRCPAALAAATQPTPVAPTLARQLGRALRRSTICFALFAAAYVGVLQATGGEHGVIDLEVVAPEHGAVAAAEVDRSAARAVELVEDHGCWAGEAPADMVGVVPGHVVVAAAGEGPRLGGSLAVGRALEQIFEGVDHGLTVYGFCR